MLDQPLTSLSHYSQFVGELLSHPPIERSTVVVWSASPYTFPHHKHVPPNIKRNRIPAPEIKFNRPNLPVLIQEIETLIQNAS